MTLREALEMARIELAGEDEHPLALQREASARLARFLERLPELEEVLRYIRNAEKGFEAGGYEFKEWADRIASILGEET